MSNKTVEAVRYREEFHPSGARKVIALMIVVGATVLPAVGGWLFGADDGRGGESARATRMGMAGMSGRYGPSGGILAERRASDTSLLGSVWRGVKRLLLVAATTLGLMLYYPRAGFKRYAVVCGPLLALLLPWMVSNYLRGRTEVFRAEVLLVTLAGMAPVAALYVWLTWRKARRIGMEW